MSFANRPVVALTFSADSDVKAAQCPVCGVLVLNDALHDRWHLSVRSEI